MDFKSIQGSLPPKETILPCLLLLLFCSRMVWCWWSKTEPLRETPGFLMDQQAAEQCPSFPPCSCGYGAAAGRWSHKLPGDSPSASGTARWAAEHGRQLILGHLHGTWVCELWDSDPKLLMCLQISFCQPCTYYLVVVFIYKAGK